ncbi:bifunctional 4-hydroxy-2-oxoglutarate aldolase/2-dehydro-3-deoxy-phosphogluconate aldolase [Erythrobacter sp.]|uniref:bifunctional 4-hydroxy-2-oxoglutarate aldolase/2-dehydro-3-deoxy-phosphogluconate aldolase n=1 Tax=Erythrobacter sp. TaxID=1042 RepID=UPI001425FACA|nr:bifunctional 4-hydroxy-2-oxoglutarate aldolase/2-dehydro-3-deoxy-phosphogluconate aldolase [Erythrobacter sp.]QIQ85412.1 MAG: bifunctional 4-hydroxy-2-oxoglutarate aldolase/2-dehydro-3-deoxy-phosphogluconate aldolase [Erythrobacter sp.]
MTDTDPIFSALAAAPVVPLVDSGDASEAVATARALVEGGLAVHEVVLRRDGALGAMRAMAERRAEIGEGLVVGAGTVLTLDQAKAARDAGAQFIVSPGLVDEIALWCIEQDLPVFPGTATAGEVQRAFALGLRAVKFFPAALAGGVPMLKALSSVFGAMRFMPTGGISAANLPEYLALPSVIACGGSWLTPTDRIAAGDYEAVTRLAREAVAIARKARG